MKKERRKKQELEFAEFISKLKTYFRVRASLKTGTLFSNDSKMEDEFWYETYRVNTLWYHEMHKCITLQWPEFTNQENAGVSVQFL